MMKKIVDVIKLGESVGRKLSDNATETDKRRISDWDETGRLLDYNGNFAA